MKITYKGDYALKAVLDLALHYDKGLVTIHEIAQRIDAPIKFMEQVLLDLKRGGFVESRRGKIGGYMLAKHPRDIKVGNIVRFIDGPIEPIACVEKNYSGCVDIRKCVFKNIWQQVAEATAGIIDSVTFEDLRQCIKQSQQVLSYII
jgi:Rrf2 family cysteine metabolism transcriptional repressor